MMILMKIKIFIEYFLDSGKQFSRELTQSQTILQDQVTKFGDHIFKDGSKVSAELFVVLKVIDKLTINLRHQ